MFGEGIIDRLPVQSRLNNPDNPMRVLLIKTAGALLDDYNVDLINVFDASFLTESTGDYLDLLGKDYGVPRKLDESDDDYRQRIIYEQVGHLTTDYLINVYNIKLYTNVDNFNPNNNTLVSDNPYITEEGFMMLTDVITKDILNKKFVLGEEITWLIL